MPKTVHCSAIVTTWLLSVAVLISAAQFDVAQAKKGRALVAAKNFKNTASACQCKQTICSSACKRTKKNFPQDALHTPTMLCAAVTEMQCSIARPSPRAEAMFSDA